MGDNKIQGCSDMKPTLALKFTGKGVRILRQRNHSWVNFAYVSLDSPTLENEFRYHLQNAKQLEIGDVSTILIMPNDLVIYTKMPVPNMKSSKWHRHIHKTLCKKNPDLSSAFVIDWVQEGDSLCVSAIEKTKLEHAEAFARCYGFEPLSFCAFGEGDFAGFAIDFGLTQFSKQLSKHKKKRSKAGEFFLLGRSKNLHTIGIGTVLVSIFLGGIMLFLWGKEENMADKSGNFDFPDARAVEQDDALFENEDEAFILDEDESRFYDDNITEYAHEEPRAYENHFTDSQQQLNAEGSQLSYNWYDFSDLYRGDINDMDALEEETDDTDDEASRTDMQDELVFSKINTPIILDKNFNYRDPIVENMPYNSFPDMDVYYMDQSWWGNWDNISEPEIESLADIYIVGDAGSARIYDALALDASEIYDAPDVASTTTFQALDALENNDFSEEKNIKKQAFVPVSKTKDAALETGNVVVEFSPHMRPSVKISEIMERRLYSGFLRAELFAYKPKKRPESQKKRLIAAQANFDSALAVLVSPNAQKRPDSLAKTVARVSKLLARQVTPNGSARQTNKATLSIGDISTSRNALDLTRINIIGIYGNLSKRYALIRLPSGRYRKISVGDNFNGGQVSAIYERSLQYIKSGKKITLLMPRI